MALGKLFQQDNGISSSYHRINRVEFDYGSACPIVIILGSYYDAERRTIEKTVQDAPPMQIEERVVILPIDDTKGYAREDLYQRIKTETDVWQDAIDC